MSPALVHQATFYRNDAEYVAALVPFLKAAIALGEPVFVAVPADRIGHLKEALGPDADRIEFADMTSVGRNPGRIIPRIREFVEAHTGTHVNFVGEPIWAGRTADEISEATCHEALINLALADADCAILCPYDASALDPDVLADAARTHPELVDGSGTQPSPGYSDPVELCGAGAAPLSPPPPDAETLPNGSLASLRDHLADEASRLPLDTERTDDLLVAVSELVNNSERHGDGAGTVRLWRDGTALVCEVADGGVIDDPLVGRRLPPPTQTFGRGLWTVHQVCDLVQLRSGEDGTVVRVRMDRD